MSDDVVTLEGALIRQTDKGVHLDVDGTPAWFPKSLTKPVDQDWEEVGEGELIEFDVPQWLAEEKGVV